MGMLASNHQAIVARENNPKRKAFHKPTSTSEKFCSTPLPTMPKQLLWLSQVTKLPSHQRSLIEEGQPVVWQVSVEEVK
jgi:hypothetical protein